jgi:DNA polymerase-3 subunit alpha
VILGGMISNIVFRNVSKSRSGLTRMAKFTFEDLSGSMPAMLWPEDFAKMADRVKPDQPVFVKGTLDRRRDPPELIVSRILTLEQGRAELARGVIVRLYKGVHQGEALQRLLRAVRERPGILELYLEIFGLEHVRRALYKAGGSLKVRYDDRLVSDLENAVGPGLVRLLGHRGATTRIDPTTTSSTGQRPRNDPLSAELSDSDSDLESDDLDSADSEDL